MFRRSLAMAAMFLGLAASTAQAQQRACITDAEGAALFQVMLPDVIREMGRVCAALPAESFLRQPSAAFMARVQAGVGPATAAAQGGIRKLLGAQGAALADSPFAIPTARAIFVPMMAQEIKPADCPGLDKIVSNLAPLPPRNLAAVFVALAQLSQNGEKRGPRLPICPMARPR
ncbi:hypothetical protein [Sphingomonas turrisvirgatae]|uniref:Uncharacterized protein n=1 Tax=Sphingomonas turrisvirgatae TaxID=1888892 RepID=A0A1E3LSL1_9SPHN|nr:hypothetical protein [Sphingomonas turrisvirgatae]ODP36175.1 hypothetical protein BFL28_07130 [Sphingomonas turrisvirgatae]